MPVNQTFPASRNATWAPTLIYDYEGAALPLAGATISMELRLYGGQPGEPQLRLAAIPFTDVRTAGQPGNASERRQLSLAPLIQPGDEDGSEANTLRSLPGLHSPEAGDPQVFFFDIRILYADGLSEILSSGTFVLAPGVTIA